MRRLSRRISPGASAAWATNRSTPGGSSALQPGVFFGKGLGDLPDRMAWPRPFGVAGAVTAEFPISRRSTTTDIDPATGRLGLVPTINGNILHWGLALEYSTLYLTDRFTGGPPKEEPLNQFVPLVEVAFDTPIGRGFGRRPQGRNWDHARVWFCRRPHIRGGLNTG